MGLWKVVECPLCHAPRARKFLWMVKCRERTCANYNPGLAGERLESSPAPALTGNFEPGPNSITVRYRNYRNEEKKFRGDRTTLRSRGRRISLCLVPTGRRCSFDRKQILNLSEIEAAMPPEAKLTAVERQIVGYHTKHGTTSPRMEEIKLKLK